MIKLMSITNSQISSHFVENRTGMQSVKVGQFSVNNIRAVVTNGSDKEARDNMTAKKAVLLLILAL